MASTRSDHGDHTAHLVLGSGVVDSDRLEESDGSLNRSPSESNR